MSAALYAPLRDARGKVQAYVPGASCIDCGRVYPVAELDDCRCSECSDDRFVCDLCSVEQLTVAIVRVTHIPLATRVCEHCLALEAKGEAV